LARRDQLHQRQSVPMTSWCTFVERPPRERPNP
jgi:hypothetical protein